MACSRSAPCLRCCTVQIGNPGASGSLLFKTADDLYIIKTLEKNEYTFILGILEKYVGHLTRMGGEVNSSLLVKFVGMFSIKKNRKIRLIAMQVSCFRTGQLTPATVSNLHFLTRACIAFSVYRTGRIRCRIKCLVDRRL